jgi:hypothetical protein
MRQDCARRHLRAWMPAYGRGADVRHLPAAEEDEAHKDHKDVVQEVEGECSFRADTCGGHHAFELRGTFPLVQVRFLMQSLVQFTYNAKYTAPPTSICLVLYGVECDETGMMSLLSGLPQAKHLDRILPGAAKLLVGWISSHDVPDLRVSHFLHGNRLDLCDRIRHMRDSRRLITSLHHEPFGKLLLLYRLG